MEYIIEFGGIPLNREQYKGENLGLWCYNKRKYFYNNIKHQQEYPEKYRLLNEINEWYWIKKDPWFERYELLKEYLNDDNTEGYPKYRTVYKKINLGNWYGRQKKAKNKLTKNKKDLLEDLEDWEWMEN